jgi:hypothetical protein
MNKLVRILNETENKMRLTTEQRITALERDNVVLHDTNTKEMYVRRMRYTLLNVSGDSRGLRSILRKCAN